jgi:hypothetical protein
MAARMSSRRLWHFAVRGARFLQSHSAKQTVDRHYRAVTITALSAFAGYSVYKAVASRTNAAREAATGSQPQVDTVYIIGL